MDGGERLTYGAWEERSDAVAAGLRRAVEPGARVALLFDGDRWTDYAVAYVAAHNAAAVAVPLCAGVDDIEVGRILRDCAATAVVAAPGLAPRGIAASILDPRKLEDQGGGLPPAPSAPVSGLAEILYPSRPLSRPAAVPRSHADLLAGPTLGPLLHAFPPGTLAAQVALRACLDTTAAGSVVLRAFDADRLCALIEAAPDRACGLHPATARAVVDSGATARHDVSRLRTLVLASGRAGPVLLMRLAAVFPRAELLRTGEEAPPGRPAAGDAPPEAVAPVAASQEGMLWHELFAPGCQNLPGLARRDRGPLRVAALGRALDEVVRRHGALRTQFELRDGRPVQVVRPHRPLEVPVLDLSHLPDGEREEAVARTVAEAGRRPFDLVAESLFVPTLLRLGAEDHVLVIRTHHSVFDDWSVGVFRRQLAKLYAAYAAGEPSPLPEPALQFTDFARRQRADLAGPGGARELAFWRRELAGAPFTVQLPVDDPGAPEGSPQGAGEPVALALAPELHDRLRGLARRERATVFMTLLAAFGVLVGRYTGQEDLVLATVVANRNRTELEGLIGCFTKKVPLRLRLDGDPTFTEALARTRSALLGALSHQDLPFETVVQDVLGAPAAAHGLVPNLALMFQGVTPRQELTLEGVESAGLDAAARAGRAHFMGAGEDDDGGEPAPLPWGAGLYAGTFVILSVEESEAGLECIARGAFHAPAVRNLMACYATLLADVAADATRRISELVVLDHEATMEVLETGRGESVPAAVATLPGALLVQVRRDPAAVAVRTRTRVLTYAELDARSDRLAARLRALCGGRGTRIGTAIEASPELIAAVLAVWRAGAAWVALDPGDSAERRSHTVGDASLEIVVGEGTIDRVESTASSAPDDAGPGDVAPEDAGPGDAAPDDAAVVFYGSGSSAVDRGVVLDHGAVLNLLTGLRRLRRGERRTGLCPRPTDDSFLRRLVALLDGDALHIPERSLTEDPGEGVRLLATGEVDLVDGTPEELRALLDAGLGDALPEHAGPVLVVGTRDGVPPELWHALRGLPGVCLHAIYGPPECAFAATAAAPGERGAGRPLANLASRVLDPRGRPVGVRAVGELHLGGPSLARGYLGDTEATRGRFVERGGERLWHTGQLARTMPDGGIELLGAAGADRDIRG
ncbi:MAG: condensation domain-containing protein, partial [Solirubrobacteraceae bacterium]